MKKYDDLGNMDDEEFELELEKKEEKRPFFKKILFTFNRKKLQDKTEIVEAESEEELKYFKEFVEDKEDDEYFEEINEAARLCEQALKIAKQKIILLDKNKADNEKIEEVKYFSVLTEEEVAEFKKLIERYNALNSDRNALMTQIMGFDKSLANIIKREEEARNILPTILDSEKSRRILNMDLAQLRGEKIDLENELSVLKSGQHFMKIFTITSVGMLVVFAIFLAYSNIIMGSEIFIPTTILVFFTIFVISFVSIFNIKINRDIKLNARKQSRAVYLINKKNVVFAYYSNFLKYEYTKYDIVGGKNMQKALGEVDHYKQLTGRIDATRRALADTEYDIIDFMKKHGIQNTKTQLSDFIETANINNKKKYFDEITRQVENTELSLSDLEVKHEVIWFRLNVLKENDKSLNGTIGEIIKCYYAEVDRLFDYLDKKPI